MASTVKNERSDDSGDRDDEHLYRQRLAEIEEETTTTMEEAATADMSQLEAKLEESHQTIREKERTLQLLQRQFEKLQAEKVKLEHANGESNTEVGRLRKALESSEKCREEDGRKLEKREAEVRSLRQSRGLDAVSPSSSSSGDGGGVPDGGVEQLRRKLEAAEKKITELLNEREQNRHVQESVSSLETDREKLSEETREIIERLGDPEQQQLIAGIIHTLELENQILKEQNESLQKNFLSTTGRNFPPESAVSFMSDESEYQIEDDYDLVGNRPRRVPSLMTPESSISGNRKGNATSAAVTAAPSNQFSRSELTDECESSVSLMTSSSYSELSQRNRELDGQVRLLQDQIESHERDIQHFESVKVDWQMEKAALEEILTKLRSQLKAKEASLTLVTAQKGLLEVKKQTPKSSREVAGSEETTSSSPDFSFEQELVKLQVEIEELTQASVHLENERDVLNLEKDKLLEEVHKLSKLNDELQSKLTENVEKYAAEAANRTDDRKKADALQSKVESLENEIVLLKEEQSSLMQNLDELDQQHQLAIEMVLKSKKELQQKVKEMTPELESMRTKYEGERKAKEEVVAELNKLKLDYEEELLNSSTDLNSELTSVKTKFKKTVEESEIRRLEIADLKTVVDQRREKDEILSRSLKDLIDQLKPHSGTYNLQLPQLHLKEDFSEDPSEVALSLLKTCLTEFRMTLEDSSTEKEDLRKKVDELIESKEGLIKELESSSQTVESLQSELLTLCKDGGGGPTSRGGVGSVWEVESWEDIVDDRDQEKSSSTPSEKEVVVGVDPPSLEKTTKLQDLELESTSSKHSKDSLEDSKDSSGEEKYGELVQRKEDLESQVNLLELRKKDLDSLVNQLESSKKNLESQEKVLEGQLQSSLNRRTELGERDEPTELGGRLQEVHKVNLSTVELTPACSVGSLSMSNIHTMNLPATTDLPTTSLSATTDLSDVDVESLITKIGNQRLELHNQESEISVLLETKAKLSEQLKELTTDKTELEESLKVLTKFKREFQTQIDDRDRQISTLNGILKIYKDDFDPERVEENKNVADEIGRKDREIEALVREVFDLKTELERLQTEKLGDATPETEKLKSVEGSLKNIEREKEQILSILNEKSRENSSLKNEVHRLMNVVSKHEHEKSMKEHTNASNLLAAVRQDESSEMTKEAMQNMAKIIRDKDVEIEALVQKNETLLQVLQQQQQQSPSDNSGNVQLQTMLEEREKLTKQVAAYQSEREQIVQALNQKHHESVSYHAEIQRLMSILSTETAKMDTLKRQRDNVTKQYEDKQKVLVDTQNEMISLKQRVKQLEEQQLELKKKYLEIVNGEENFVKIKSEDLRRKDEDLGNLERSGQEKDKLLFEKDRILRDYQIQIQQIHEESSRKSEEIRIRQRQLDSLNSKLGNLQTEVEEEKFQVEETQQKLEDTSSETSILRENSNRLTLMIQQKDFELNAAREKIETLTKLMQGGGSNSGSVVDSEISRLVNESESMQKRALEFQQERDQVMLALSQRQKEVGELHSEVKLSHEREERLKRELERLRLHLIQVEENYTQEALYSEEREKALRTKLHECEEKLQNVETSTNSYQVSLQVESLQEQLHTIAQQRDATLLKLDSTEDHVQQLTASLQTLQVVLEQFQQEKERDLASAEVEFNKRLKQEKRVEDELQQQIKHLELRLSEASEALDAASRLSEQLDSKEETVIALKGKVTELENLLRKANDENNQIASHSEGKVDKSIVKNLLVNYFGVHHQQKLQVLRIIATVLDFNHEERLKTGLESNPQGWIPSFLKRGGASGQTIVNTHGSTATNQSLSQAFIQFLESESRPNLSVKLPAEAMVQEVTKRNDHLHPQHHHHQHYHPPRMNPFNVPVAPVVVTWPGVTTSGGGGDGSSIPSSSSSMVVGGDGGTTSHLLMQPMTAALPTFTPIVPIVSPSAVSSSSSNILRDVLKRD